MQLIETLEDPAKHIKKELPEDLLQELPTLLPAVRYLQGIYESKKQALIHAGESV